MIEDDKKAETTKDATTENTAIDRERAILKIRSALRAGARKVEPDPGPICPPTCTCGDYNL